VAVVVLAGGPGQAAIPFAPSNEQEVAPLLTTRDLVVFDQRGTGTSGPLSCNALTMPSASDTTAAEVLGECANQIGAAAQFYSTADSVADLEALRQAGGYQQLFLVGFSYGTWVAMQYARAHPAQTAGLVLDSTLAPTGPDPTDAATFAAIPGVLGNLCADGACAKITADPFGELSALAEELQQTTLKAPLYHDHGQKFIEAVSEADLLRLLIDGDSDPHLLAGLPAAIHSALRGDPVPLAFLEGTDNGGAASDPTFDDTLSLATRCEDTPFGWQPSTDAATRVQQSAAALNALPSSSFAPFDTASELSSDGAALCAGWPYIVPAGSPAPAALPTVPTLIFSGAEDLRTPTSNARAVAADIPGAQVVVDDHQGHSVLSSDSSGCAGKALVAFAASQPLPDCSTTSVAEFEKPTTVLPARPRDLPAYPGQPVAVGHRLAAVLATLDESHDRLQELADYYGGSSARPKRYDISGLRGGWVRLPLDYKHGPVLHEYSFIGGIKVTGTLAAGRPLRIVDSRASGGTIVISANGRVRGMLDGRPLRTSFPRTLLEPPAIGS
jgi:pimeloyl-ACP methyl ester carboxylesterase